MLMEKRRAKFVKSNRSIVRSMLRQYSAKLIADIRKAGDTSQIIALGERELKDDYVRECMEKVYGNTVPYFSKQTAKALQGKKREAIEVDAWEEYIKSFVRSRLGDRIYRLNLFTQNLFQAVTKDAVMQGISNGWGINKIADQIQRELNIVETYRAERIARTETISASNEGSIHGARGTGLSLKKEWISYIDDRTRETHREMNGKTVGMDESFSMPTDDGDRDELDYPGDPNGSAENVINCRCTIGYVPADEVAWGRDIQED